MGRCVANLPTKSTSAYDTAWQLILDVSEDLRERERVGARALSRGPTTERDGAEDLTYVDRKVIPSGDLVHPEAGNGRAGRCADPHLSTTHVHSKGSGQSQACRVAHKMRDQSLVFEDLRDNTLSADNVRSLGNQGRELLRTIPGSSSERYRHILGYIRICTNEVGQHHDTCVPNMFWDGNMSNES